MNKKFINKNNLTILTMKNKFKILERGNFYFPFMDKEKKFIVENTIDIELDKKYTTLIDTCLKNKNMLYLGMLADSIWDSFKKEAKRYKNCWFVPVVLNKFGKNYICSIDVLRKVR